MFKVMLTAYLSILLTMAYIQDGIWMVVSFAFAFGTPAVLAYEIGLDRGRKSNETK